MLPDVFEHDVKVRCLIVIRYTLILYGVSENLMKAAYDLLRQRG